MVKKTHRYLLLKYRISYYSNFSLPVIDNDITYVSPYAKHNIKNIICISNFHIYKRYDPKQVNEADVDKWLNQDLGSNLPYTKH